MSLKYAEHFSPKSTPQSEPVPGKQMVENSAGGYAFALDDWKRLDRFLVLGCEGSTYYASEQQLTRENAQAVVRCLDADPVRAVERVAQVSDAGRAPKNDPAIFVLALAAAHGDERARRHAYLALPKVCRIGTHLFQFVGAVEALGRGWGRGLKRAVSEWYGSKSVVDAAFQCLKYQQRGGWSHRDLLRLSHPKTADGDRNTLYHWITKGWESVGDEPHPSESLRQVWAYERLKREPGNVALAVKLIADYQLQREMLPTELLVCPDVWEALLEKMPLTAMVRNLGTMTKIGLLKPLSAAEKTVVDRLGDVDYLRRSRVHPVAVLSALKTYAQGRGERGSSAWTPSQRVCQALDDAFYLSFGNVAPSGKRWYLGVDVSGSMWSGSVAGVVGLTPGMAAAAMAMVTAGVEPAWYAAAFNTEMVPFGISPGTRLDALCGYMKMLSWGGTDCARPMLHALDAKLDVDVFCLYTDNETWFGSVHPFQALERYRQKTGIPAKLAVVGMTSTGFSIADPSADYMLDCVGFDQATPQVLSDFAS